jgi:branched-chain amino acid transport system permease protein
MAANGSAPREAGGRHLAFGSIFKEAGLTALVSLALLIPVVGFKIANRGGDQFLETRWPEVIIAAALIFFGRILLILIREGRLALPVAGGAVISAVGWLAPMPSDFMQVVAVTAGLVIIARAVFVVFAPCRVEWTCVRQRLCGRVP